VTPWTAVLQAPLSLEFSRQEYWSGRVHCLIITLHAFLAVAMKALMLGKIEGKRRRGVTEDEMVGWHHQLNGHKFEQTLGDSEGQRSLVSCSAWGHKESDTTSN